MNFELLDDPHQRDVAERSLAQESAKRHHLVVHLSGAHAYGFPSTDSDLDIKCVHIEATSRLLGLSSPRSTANRLQIIEGVEFDYTSNELQQCVSGLLSGDGNMLERVTSGRPVVAHAALNELRDLAIANLSKHYFRHYRGFARSQERRLIEGDRPTAKRLLYVLRTAVTGAHLLLERECEPNLARLAARYGFPEVPELVEIKRGAETGILDEAWAERVPDLRQRAFELLDRAHERSPLPDAPGDRDALEAWLLELRRDHWT